MSDFVRGVTPDFVSFFDGLRGRQSPAVLWYSVPGERIELSGRVLDNWVSKTANFLVDECELEAGGGLALDATVHWRSLIFVLAGLRVGAELELGSAGEGAQVEVAFEAGSLEGSDADYPVLVDRGPLSMRFMGTLPVGVTDYCAEVRSHADVYGGFELPSPGARALDSLTFEDIVAQVQERASTLALALGGEPRAVLLGPGPVDADWVIDLLAVLAAGYAALVLDPSLAWEEERRVRVLADELAVPLP